jgi:hypothetical protein
MSARFPLKLMPRSTSSVVDVAPKDWVMVKSSLFYAPLYAAPGKHGLMEVEGTSA